MTLGKDRWHAISPSAYEWEREALDFIRNRLPDTDPYRAWANFEFLTREGAIYEVDLLVLTKNGLFFVEVKSRPGRVRGDASTWKWEREKSPRDNPLILANRKAKALKSLIDGRRGAWKKVRCPYIEPLVFLSAEDNQIELDEVGRTRVVVRDQPGEDVDTTKRPTIFRALLRGEGPGLEHRRPPIDRRIAQALDQAMAEIVLLPSRREHRVGEYELESDPEDEGPGWQDFIGRHQAITEEYVRARRYLVSAAIRDEEQRWLRRAAEREYRVLSALRHPSILKAKDFINHELGPTLLFEWREGTRRLDLFIKESWERLTIDSKLAILQSLADALRYVHRKNIVHRALSPRSILIENPDAVVSAGAEPELRITGFQLARRLGTTTTPTVTRNVEQLIDPSEHVYIAPELRRDPGREDDGPVLDIFSFGAIAYLIVTGRPPASDAKEIDAILRARGGLDPAAVLDGVASALRDLILESTAPAPSKRYATADDLLEVLEVVEDDLTAPPPIPVESYPDPLQVRAGTVLRAPELLGTEFANGFFVEATLGRGSTALALAVRRIEGPKAGEGESEAKAKSKTNGEGDDNGSGDGNGDGRESARETSPSGLGRSKQLYALKIALDESRARALLDESQVLEKLRHDSIVGVLGVLSLSGRTALLLEHAGDKTLRDLLRRDRGLGLGLDFLERYGEELLRAVGHLEEKGIAHRDIKPENIAIQTAGKRRYRLVLFDFSLSRAPRDEVNAGTPGYLDPFLDERPAKRWDPAADRWATAVTLHEMALGTRPRFGADGRSDPATTGDEVFLDPERFDVSVREGLKAFFEKALARKVEDRYASADDMLHSWRRAFARSHEEKPPTQKEFELGGLRPDDPIHVLDLSTRAEHVLDRRNILAVRDLLEYPLRELIFLRGVGKKTRDELVACVRALRREFPHVEERRATSPDRVRAADDGQGEGDRGDGGDEEHAEEERARRDTDVPLEVLHARLVGRPPKGKGEELRYKIRRTLLAANPEETYGDDWFPTQRDIAGRHGCTNGRVGQVLADERRRWTKDKNLRDHRTEFASLLGEAAGVFTLAEAVDAVLSLVEAGGSDSRFARLRAVAVVRALVETESAAATPRFDAYRIDDRVFIAHSRELASWAKALGEEADRIAEAEPLLAPERAIGRLREIAAPASRTATFDAAADRAAVGDDRLLRLAARAGRIAAISARGEIYPRDMDAERALRLGAGALHGIGAWTGEGSTLVQSEAPELAGLHSGEFEPAEVRARIRARYPMAQELPDHPELETLLRKIGIDVIWDKERRVYRRPRAQTLVTSTGKSPLPERLPTELRLPPRQVDPEIARARDFEDLLRARFKNDWFLVLTVADHEMLPCIDELARRFPAFRTVSLERELIRGMREVVSSYGGEWSAVCEVDRDGESASDWPDLVGVAKEVLYGTKDGGSPGILPRLLESKEPLLLLYPGLLARYDAMDVLETLRDEAGRAGRVPRVWVLVAADDQHELPRLDGKEIPLLGSGQHLRVPAAWIRNIHRSEGAA